MNVRNVLRGMDFVRTGDDGTLDLWSVDPAYREATAKEVARIYAGRLLFLMRDIEFPGLLNHVIQSRRGHSESPSGADQAAWEAFLDEFSLAVQHAPRVSVTTHSRETLLERTSPLRETGCYEQDLATGRWVAENVAHDIQCHGPKAFMAFALSKKGGRYILPGDTVIGFGHVIAETAMSAEPNFSSHQDTAFALRAKDAERHSRVSYRAG